MKKWRWVTAGILDLPINLSLLGHPPSCNISYTQEEIVVWKHSEVHSSEGRRKFRVQKHKEGWEGNEGMGEGGRKEGERDEVSSSCKQIGGGAKKILHFFEENHRWVSEFFWGIESRVCLCGDHKHWTKVLWPPPGSDLLQVPIDTSQKFKNRRVEIWNRL